MPPAQFQGIGRRWRLWRYSIRLFEPGHNSQVHQGKPELNLRVGTGVSKGIRKLAGGVGWREVAEVLLLRGTKWR